MAINSEIPNTPSESPRTLETLRRRGEVIATVNEVYDLMRGVALDLEQQPQRTNSQEKQIIDFGIVKAGRELLVGADLPLTDEGPTDRFINEVKDPKTGKVFRIEEGIPAEPFKYFLDREIHDLEVRLKASGDPGTQYLLENLLIIRKEQLETIEVSSSPYTPKSREERDARVEQEAYLIFNDPRRKTFSEKNDYYTGEAEIEDREFIDIPPRLTISPSEGSANGKVTNAYIDGYKAIEEGRVRRRMPSADSSNEADMPDKDSDLTSEDGRIPDSVEGRSRRRMPSADSTSESDMPDKDQLAEGGDSRMPDTNYEGKIIVNAYTSETENADRIVNAYGLETAGDEVASRGTQSGTTIVVPRDKRSAFSYLGNYNVPENERVTNAYGLKTERRPLPKRAGSERNVVSIGDRTNEKTKGPERESKLRRLKRISPLIAGMVGLIGLALLLQDRGNERGLSPSTGAGEVATTPAGVPFGPELIQGPEKPPVKLTGHFYRNEPDVNGLFGSFYGHTEFELGKVLDPTLQQSGDIDRLEQVLGDLEQANPKKFDKIIDEYKQGVLDNNPPGTLAGEDNDGIARSQFVSRPMEEIYKEVMSEEEKA